MSVFKKISGIIIIFLAGCTCPDHCVDCPQDSCNYDIINEYVIEQWQLIDSAVNQVGMLRADFLQWKFQTIDSIEAWKNYEYQKLIAWKDSVESLHVEMYDNMIIRDPGEAEVYFDSITGKPAMKLK